MCVMEVASRRLGRGGEGGGGGVQGTGLSIYLQGESVVVDVVAVFIITVAILWLM